MSATLKNVVYRAIAVLTLIPLGALPGFGPSVQAAQVVRPVVADTWIDGTNSGSIRGSDLALGICPVANYWIYLKFDLGGVEGDIVSAELRLTRFNGTRPEEISSYLIDDDSWTEATLSGLNRPEPTSPAPSAALGVGAFDAAGGYDRWTSAGLDAVVRQESAGDGVLTVMLRENPAQMFDVRNYRSREASVPASQRPQLILFVAPSEVQVLRLDRVAGHTQLTWAPGSAGAAYDVIGGRLADVSADLGISSAACLGDAIGGTAWTDPAADPAEGDARYYLVRAADATAAGTYGFASGGDRGRPLADCP